MCPLLHTCLKDPALTYFQSLDLDVQNNFQAAVQALEQRFNDANIQASLCLDLHSQKQGLIESVFDYSNTVEKSFLRLNITDEYYKLLLFFDGLQPHLQLDVNKQGPTTYLKAKEITVIWKVHYVNKHVNMQLLFQRFSLTKNLTILFLD